MAADWRPERLLGLLRALLPALLTLNEWAPTTWAQTAAKPDARPAQFDIRYKDRRYTPLDLLASFSAPEGGPYQIGEGDEISIEVWGRPELSGKHVVGPDGRITLPVAGDVSILDLTREESVEQIRKAFDCCYQNLSVMVRVDRYASNRVFILGRVTHPGALLFETQPTLLEAITRAGALPVGGMGSEKAALTRCAIFRGRDQVAWIDLKSLLVGGNMALNVRLRRNDLIYMPDADDQLVYVLGEVRTPGAMQLTPDMSFLDAFAKAGGPTEDASSSSIHVIRPSRNWNREFSLADLLQPNRALNIALEEGDVIYVPKKTLAKMGYVLQRIGPITGLTVLGGAFLK
ncbi:MAG: SLBB domain-containing protein [Bryobacteraceae bacterium]